MKSVALCLLLFVSLCLATTVKVKHPDVAVNANKPVKQHQHQHPVMHPAKALPPGKAPPTKPAGAQDYYSCPSTSSMGGYGLVQASIGSWNTIDVASPCYPSDTYGLWYDIYPEQSGDYVVALCSDEPINLSVAEMSCSWYESSSDSCVAYGYESYEIEEYCDYGYAYVATFYVTAYSSYYILVSTSNTIDTYSSLEFTLAAYPEYFYDVLKIGSIVLITLISLCVCCCCCCCIAACCACFCGRRKRNSQQHQMTGYVAVPTQPQPMPGHVQMSTFAPMTAPMGYNVPMYAVAVPQQQQQQVQVLPKPMVVMTTAPQAMTTPSAPPPVAVPVPVPVPAPTQPEAQPQPQQQQLLYPQLPAATGAPPK